MQCLGYKISFTYFVLRLACIIFVGIILMLKKMKKILLLLSVAVLLFASCEGPAGRPGFDGEDGKDFDFHIENFTIKSKDWQRVSIGKYATLYECVKLNVEVTEKAYEEGVVHVYMFQWNDASNSEVQTQLPYWVQHVDGDNTWLEGYNFDFDATSVAFYVECANGTTPPECEFRVVVAP